LHTSFSINGLILLISCNFTGMKPRLNIVDILKPAEEVEVQTQPTGMGFLLPLDFLL